MLSLDPMQQVAEVVYGVPRTRRGWELSEEKMPESVLHDQAVELLRQILAWWARDRENVQIARNLAVRWDEDEPRVGVDPDVCVLSPAPPAEENLRSVRTWMPGHHAPAFAVEVVSDSDPRKDYTIAPDKYAASGTRELCVFDPLLAGPAAHGGPFLLQLWRRDDQGRFVRAYAGDGPAESQVLGAHLVVVDDGKKLRVADDADGAQLWPTATEAERTAKEAERTAKEAERTAKEVERTAKEAALARVAELEAELAKRS
jgi:hypothetical protein